jgi:diguanylate cyclase (GGDEF)-like protein
MNNSDKPATPAASQTAQAVPTAQDLSPITRGPGPAPAAITVGELEHNLSRIKRIGKRLLGVANCIITLDDGAASSFPPGERSMAALEAAFCARLPAPSGVMVVPDARSHADLSKHRAVVGAPYIRFYAAQPIFNAERTTIIGCVHLIGYATRVFSKEEYQSLADLVALTERELRFNTMNASQIDLLKKNRSLRRESLIDPVIGTWNRVAITRMLATETERCYNEAKPLSVVFADLDSLKQINDAYGHPAADNILLKFASRLRSCIRPSDALGRYEGETFMIVLPGASHTIAKVVAERIRQAIMAQPEQIGDEVIQLTLSLGTVSTDNFPAAAIDDLITHADSAQRAAKNAGRNRIIHAVPEPS